MYTAARVLWEEASKGESGAGRGAGCSGGGSPSAVPTAEARARLPVNGSEVQEPVPELVFRTSGLTPLWRW